MRKKIIVSSLTAALMASTAWAAPSTTAQVEEMVKHVVLSEDVEYQGASQVKTIANGYEVTTPAGVLKSDKKTAVPSFVFNMFKSGSSKNGVRYQLQLKEASQIFPALTGILKDNQITYSALNYQAFVVPEHSLVEKQELRVSGLTFPAAAGAVFKAGQVLFTDTADLNKDTDIKSNTSISLQGIAVTHALANLSADSFDFKVDIPSTTKAKNPIEQVVRTPQLKQTMSAKNVQITIPADKDFALSFDLDQDLDFKQDQKDYNVSMELKWAFTNIQAKGIDSLPSVVSSDISATGFTVGQMLTYSAQMDNYQRAQDLPKSPSKDLAVKTAEKEAKDAYDKLLDKLVVTVNQVLFEAPQYRVVLKGTIVPKLEQFKGTFQVTNFDYLAPEPKKIDDAACKAVIDKMVAGELAGEAFTTAYKDSCDDNRGALDVLRPYRDTARKVKDAKGQDALIFDVEYLGDDLYINRQKVTDEQMNNVLGGVLK